MVVEVVLATFPGLGISSTCPEPGRPWWHNFPLLFWPADEDSEIGVRRGLLLNNNKCICVPGTGNRIRIKTGLRLGIGPTLTQGTRTCSRTTHLLPACLPGCPPDSTSSLWLFALAQSVPCMLLLLKACLLACSPLHPPFSTKNPPSSSPPPGTEWNGTGQDRAGQDRTGQGRTGQGGAVRVCACVRVCVCVCVCACTHHLSSPVLLL